jgi:hypothetical protein
MAKQRYINTHFWDDSYITELDPIEKLLFLYLLTNPLTNIAGAYEISLKRIAFDTGIDKDMVLKILARFEVADRIIYREGWVLILKFIKNQSFNPKMLSGVEEIVKCCPDWIKHRLSIAYQSLSHLNRDLNRDSNPMPNGKPIGNGAIINEEAEAELNGWLDEIAKTVGATSRHTLADHEKWERVCMKAIDDGKTLDQLISVTRSELLRNKESPQFFSPNNVLKQIQITTTGQAPTPYINPFTGRGLK